jgi:hypothetical protein
MRHWNRRVSLVSHDIAELLQAEIKLRWPESKYPLHIEVIGSEDSTRLAVRVWQPEGVHIVHETCPMKFLNSSLSGPTIAAVLRAIEAALAEARIQNPW